MSAHVLARSAVVVALAAVALTAAGGIAVAQFTSAVTAAPTVSTLALGDPGAASATTADGCATVTVSWTAAANADSYRVQVSENGGPWSDLVTETADVAEISDATGHTAAAVTYRVFSRDAASNWEGSNPAATAALQC